MVSLTRDREAWRLGVCVESWTVAVVNVVICSVLTFVLFLFTFMFDMFTFYDIACLKN